MVAVAPDYLTPAVPDCHVAVAPVGAAAMLQVVTVDPDEITPAQRMAAGALAGACAQATIYPFELVRSAAPASAHGLLGAGLLLRGRDCLFGK